MRAGVLLGLAVLAGCGRVPAAKTATEPAPKEVKRGETAPKVSPRPAPPGKRPDPPAPATFDGAWAEAVEMGRRLDAEEPAATTRALAVLTAGERDDVREQMGDELSEVAGSLVRAGFVAWVARESRRAALADPAFRGVARELWDGSGPRHLLGMMNGWGAVDPLVRREVAAAVARKAPTAGLDPAVRDAILHVGGGGWLAR